MADYPNANDNTVIGVLQRILAALTGGNVGGTASGAMFVRRPTTNVDTSQSNIIGASGGTNGVAMYGNSRMEILNPSTSTLWASWGTPSVNGPGSFPIAPGGSYVTEFVNGVVSLMSTVAGQPYTVNRMS